MKEADYYTLISDQNGGQVQCFLCSHRCKIKNHRRGICRVRENRDGKLFSLVYGRLVSENTDPIEKKPLFHFLPGSSTYSIATIGCNFRCQHCQNYDISQYPSLYEGDFPGMRRTPQDVVDTAIAYGCESISYTYIEPTIFMEFAVETAALAHEAGLKNVFVSNGYTTPEVSREIAPYLDANNIDLKAFTEKFYRDICGAKLLPVLETIKLMKKLGVWVEVTTLIIPDLNDSASELTDLASFIYKIDPDIPWHVTRFHPTFKMTDRNSTPPSTLCRAREIGLNVGLNYVYEGNVPGSGGENTFCPSCGKTIIERFGFSVRTDLAKDGFCHFCRKRLPGIFYRSD